VRTTIDIPDPVFRKMKAAAALQGSTIKKFVLFAVERQLAPVEANKRNHRAKLPLIRGKEKRVLKLTNADIDEVLFG
jgi:Antitoxin ParD